MATYTSQYPTQDANHVKATSEHSSNQFHPYYATNPALTLTGASNNNSWICELNTLTNQRFHIDLGSAMVIRRIYYENWHDTGSVPNRGVNNFTFWGSNIGAGSFDDLVWGNDGGWTELTVDNNNEFDIHVALDQADPKYIIVTNSTAYRYFACKFADNHGGTSYMGVRRIELQTEDGYGEVADNAIFFGCNF